MRKLGLWLIVQFWLLVPQAQASLEDQPASAFRDPHKSWLILPALEVPFVDFKMVERDGAKEERTFKSNASSLLGARVAYEGYAVGYSLSLDNRSDVARYGKSRALDHGLSYHGEHFSLSGRLQRYSGLYSEDRSHRRDRVEKRPDIKVTNYEASGLYVFDPSALSLEAAWGFSKIQLVSGGSWLAMLSLQHLEIEGDQPLVAQVTRFRMDALSVLGGYGYNFIGEGSYYGMIAGLIGAGVQRRELGLGEREKAHTGFGIKVNCQMSIGRNGDDYLYGLTFNMLTTSSEIDAVQIDYTLTPISLFAGVRL